MFKVLIVEDEVLLRKAINKLIETKNEIFEVCFEASNGSVALEYIRKNRVDLVITDIRMPIMTGLQLLHELRNAGFTTRVIIISGFCDFDYARQAIESDVDAYLLKPLVPDEFYKKIDDVAKSLRTDRQNFNLLKKEKLKSLMNGEKVEFNGEKIDFRGEIVLDLLTSKQLFSCCINLPALFTNTLSENISEQLEELFYPCAISIIDNNLYIILSLENIVQDKDELCHDIKVYLEDAGVFGTIGIGTITNDISNIGQSMLEAKKASELFISSPDCCNFSSSNCCNLLEFQRLSFSEDHEYNYPIFEEKKLIDIVLTGNFEKITDAFKSFINALGSISWDEKKEALLELCNNCKHEFQQYKLSFSFKPILNSIANKQSLLLTIEQIETQLVNCGNQILNAKRSSYSQIINQVKQFIMDHALEKFSLDDVASTSHLSKSHFCKIFKAETGFTFKDYLNKVRIDRAKDLLLNTQMKNYEIAFNTGFEDCSYFNQIFKRITGLTPAEYKKSVRKLT